jgi:hypothetical protein
MRKFFGSSMAGLYESLPTIVAELSEEIAFNERGHMVAHDRGSRTYLVLQGEDPLASDTAECLVRTKLNQFRVRDIPWSKLRFAEIARVPANIGERCWRGTKDEMEEMLRRIQSEKMPRKPQFAPDVDLD